MSPSHTPFTSSRSLRSLRSLTAVPTARRKKQTRSASRRTQCANLCDSFPTLVSSFPSCLSYFLFVLTYFSFFLPFLLARPVFVRLSAVSQLRQFASIWTGAILARNCKKYRVSSPTFTAPKLSSRSPPFPLLLDYSPYMHYYTHSLRLDAYPSCIKLPSVSVFFGALLILHQIGLRLDACSSCNKPPGLSVLFTSPFPRGGHTSKGDFASHPLLTNNCH